MEKKRTGQPWPDPEEKQLVLMARNGNEKERKNAFGEIYRKCYLKCAGFLVSKFGQRTAIEDVVQNAVIVLKEKLDNQSFVLTCRIQTFLNTVAYNKGLTEFGKPKEQILAEDDIEDITDEYFAPMEEPLNNERIKVVLSVLEDPDKTSDICREIISGFWLRQQLLEQIAAAMGYKNTDVAKTRKSYCLAKLKEEVVKLLKGK